MANKPFLKLKRCDWCAERIPRYTEIHENIDNGGFVMCSEACRKKVHNLINDNKRKG